MNEDDDEDKVTNPVPLVFFEDEEPPPAEYLDYDPATTRVISGPLGDKDYPGRRFQTRSQARRYWTTKAGKIIEDLSVPGRWIFRVKKEGH